MSCHARSSRRARANIRAPAAPSGAQDRPQCRESLRVPAIAAQVMLAAWVSSARWPWRSASPSDRSCIGSWMTRARCGTRSWSPTRTGWTRSTRSTSACSGHRDLDVRRVVPPRGTGILSKRPRLASPVRHRMGHRRVRVVPFVNLYMPKRIADDMWAANQEPSTDTRTYGMPTPKSALIYCWWGAWIVAAILGIIVGQSPDPTTLQGMLDQNGLYLARRRARGARGARDLRGAARHRRPGAVRLRRRRGTCRSKDRRTCRRVRADRSRTVVWRGVEHAGTEWGRDPGVDRAARCALERG